MFEFRELCFRRASLLDIIGGPMVNGLDHDFLSAFSGEENERNFTSVLLENLQKSNPVNIGHLVIGQDYIKAECFQDDESIPDAIDRSHAHIRLAFEIEFTHIEESGI